MSALGWKKKRRHFEENEINDGESPLADTPASPSGVFINSSRIQLVGLFVRRFSLTPPSYRLRTPFPSCHVRYLFFFIYYLPTSYYLPLLLSLFSREPTVKNNIFFTIVLYSQKIIQFIGLVFGLVEIIYSAFFFYYYSS